MGLMIGQDLLQTQYKVIEARSFESVDRDGATKMQNLSEMTDFLEEIEMKV